MPHKPHIKLNTAKQAEPTIAMRFNYGGGANEENEDPNYMPMVETFRTALGRFSSDRVTRIRERNPELHVPVYIDYIHITFQDQFEIINSKGSSNYQIWYNEYGLMGVQFSNFNHEGLFAVINQDKFRVFLDDIQHFILRESGERTDVEYQAKVKFIRDFRLLTTQEIIGDVSFSNLMNLRLLSLPLDADQADDIIQSLGTYLDDRNIRFDYNDESNLLELTGATQPVIEEIAKNFDVVLNVTSSFSTVVRPTDLNTVERDYGFEISNADDDLPLIGVLDTGISMATPLQPILMDDDTFNLTGSSPLVDNADHGTGVAALAALGRTPYQSGYRGEFEADAKLLSMKILDDAQSEISQKSVLQLLQRAKETYPEIKIFILTVGYKKPLANNAPFSSYALMLDKFAHENDCLLFISTTNNEAAGNQPDYSLAYFGNEETNICVPAESMNNVIVGCAADNLKEGAFVGISPGREFPTLFSRRGATDLSILYKNKPNKNLFRPDVIESGGDWESREGMVGSDDEALMEVLSSNPAFGYNKAAGTSYSAPLCANIAAKILKQYPNLKAQSIKALILNSATLDKIKFDGDHKHLQNRVAGHGIVNVGKSVFSDDNRIAFILEEEINLGELKVFPLNFPTYLTNNYLVNKSASVKITATLCFSFNPVNDNHLSYCPIQMAFTVFRNHTADQILLSEETIKSQLRERWSQNNRYKSKPVPASNSQKIQFKCGTKELLSEDYTFKLAVHCRISEQLFAGEDYNYPHQFSMAITIEESQKESKLTGRLYTEMIAINEVESIVEGDLDIEGDLEL